VVVRGDTAVLKDRVSFSFFPLLRSVTFLIVNFIKHFFTFFVLFFCSVLFHWSFLSSDLLISGVEVRVCTLK
jgi:hypothetical protein